MKKTTLRQQAEEKLSKRKKSPVTETDSLRLLHELEVHQIELEMQNAELAQARAETEATLRQYTDLYDFAPVGFFTLARDGAISQVNLTGSALLGADAERGKLIKRRFGVFVSAESRSIFAAFLERVFESGQKEICEVALQSEGHALLWAHIEATRSENGQECRAVVSDITARKRAEDQLGETQSFLATLLEMAPLSIYTLALDNRFRLVNRQWAQDTQVEREKAIGRSLEELFPAELARKYEADNQQVLQSHSMLTFEEWAETPNGMCCYYTLKFPLRNAHGVIENIGGISLDITERKQAEEKTRRQLERMNGLREIDQAITAATSDTHLSMNTLVAHTANLLAVDAVTLLLFNSETNRLEYGSGFGFQTEAVKTASVKLVESYAGRAVIERHIIDIHSLADDPHDLLLTELLKGENFLSYYGAPLIVKDKVVGVLEVFHRSIIVRDAEWLDFFNILAEQAAIVIDNVIMFENLQHTNIELEKRVRERTADLSLSNADLARALRSRNEFLASMSHELRTPLTGILGFSEALQLRTYGDLSPRQFNAIKIIEESGRHLLDLINDVLDLSKIEAGKLELQMGLCSLADICQASLQLTKGMAQQKKQNIIYSPATEPVFLNADARRLKQILVNLLGNAVKFTPVNGELGLEVQANQSEQNVKITVWDKGIGIKPEDKHKLFKPFTQIDSSLAREYSGTGLGLSLVQRLSEIHNGSIEIESVFGEGSRFTIVLPWLSQETTPISNLPHSAAADNSDFEILADRTIAPLILLLDDNETILEMVSDYLQEKKYRVTKVSSGLELLERVSELRPDVILVDIQMPGMDGLETIRRIRDHKDASIAATPIIAVTALAMPGDLEYCLRAGANDYMSKPLKLSDLTKRIEKQIARKP